MQVLFNTILASKNITLKAASKTATNTFASWSNNYHAVTKYNSQKKTCKLSYRGKFAFISPTQYSNAAGLLLQKAAYQLARKSRSPTRSPTRRAANQHLSKKGTNNEQQLKDESNAAMNGEKHMIGYYDLYFGFYL